jgi:hypothetical protein
LDDPDDNEDDPGVSPQQTPQPPPVPPVARPVPDLEEDPFTPTPNFVPVIEDIRIAQEYIRALRNASLDSETEKLDPEFLDRLRKPPTEELKIDDPSLRLSLDIFISTSNASQQTYNDVCASIQRRFPKEQLLSHYKVKRLVEDLTGIIPIMRDMCINSCIGFTGPYADDLVCAMCGESRYEAAGGPGSKTPRKQFVTIPIGPQLQALWRTPAGAEALGYRDKYVEKLLDELKQNHGVRQSPYRDFFDGRDFLDRYVEGKIRSGDMVLVMSMDGAQLYRNKISECWMYIWIIFDHSPDGRYKKHHIQPGGFIPGPKKPKNQDSFVFTGLHHLAALQKEGLVIWDAKRKVLFISKPFLALTTADGPGMACLSGFVGHQGKIHCRFYCPLIGRHKPLAPSYYPVRFKPDNYTVDGCDHPDVDLNALLTAFTSTESTRRYKENLAYVSQSRNPTEFKRRRLETGICKPSILLGLPEEHILGLPGCFPGDIMHLPTLNAPDLFLPLWRGTFECDETDNKNTWDWVVLKGVVWKAHGKRVADATSYLPGSFDRPPRNPAEKISSGYKAWEFLLYFYGLGPGFFFQLLPDKYWRHYCKLVRGFRILMQEEIYQSELHEAHKLLTEFSDSYEELYVQRRADRLHFVRPSIHAPSHMAPETERVGPGIIYSQWAIERTIGNLGEEIKQHSNPYANLSQRGLRRCQVNALKAMIPDLVPVENPLPQGALDLGDEYSLLRAMDTAAREVRPCEKDALVAYEPAFERGPLPLKVVRWARLRLPNRQVVRSRWKEDLKPLNRLRCSRNIKVNLNYILSRQLS